MRPPRPMPEIAIPNLAPMVDVVMVILIFFMLGTSFAVSEGVLRTQLPSQLGTEGGAGVPVIPLARIELRKQEGREHCEILVMGQPLRESSSEALFELLDEKRRAGADAAGRILVMSDPDVRYSDVIAAMDACHRAGLSNVQLIIGTSTPGIEAAAP